VSYADALAYAKWAGKDLPTEAEWEFSARGGLDGAEFAWGDEFTPGGVHMANTWQGEFPLHNLREDGYERTSPVTAFPPNGYGVHDMIGNVWEWTSTAWSESQDDGADRSVCCSIACPRTAPVADHESDDLPPVPPRDLSSAPGGPEFIIKGGSHLCSVHYCDGFNPAKGQAHAAGATTGHLGFRCAGD
jgi:formylglycine-generating enzyme required for sulfatase activity